MEFTQQNLDKIHKGILPCYPNKRAALLPVLWLAQEQFGYLPNDALECVAKVLGLSPIHVYSVATFYTMFHRTPPGRHHIQVCRTLSCALNGADKIVDHLKDKLHIDEGGITADGRFSLCTVECLASCGIAPMMQVNDAYYENLTPGKVDGILESLK